MIIYNAMYFINFHNKKVKETHWLSLCINRNTAMCLNQELNIFVKLIKRKFNHL